MSDFVKDQCLENCLYISALEHVMKLILSNYVLIASINTILSMSPLRGFVHVF